MILVGAPSFRLELGRGFGADEVIDITGKSSQEIIEEVLYLTKRGTDVTIEATGSPKAIVEGLRMTRDGGIYTVVGQYTNGGEVSINPHLDINKKHIDIRGVWGSDFSHFYRSIELMKRHVHHFPWHKMASKIYGLEECGEAIKDVENLKVMKAVINPQVPIST